MNEAQVIIVAVSLALAFGLGLWTGCDTDNEFFPNGIAVLFCIVLVAAFIGSLFKLVMNSL